MNKAVGTKRRIEIFRTTEAIDNSSPQGMRAGTDVSPETLAKLKVLRDAGRDDGLTSHILYRQKDGFSLIHLWIKPHYPLPRHSHDSDCLYYVVRGSLVMGTETLRASDGFFVPAHANYTYVGGPEGGEVIEVRYGPNGILTHMPAQSDARYETELAMIQANREAWLKMTISPNFADNLAGRAADHASAQREDESA
jgi:mannose-6-phosphate isomerase-like protein (cupin superfamily)